MSNTSDQLLKAQKDKAITQIANVSRLLRDAISASIPVAPEQYLTVSVPGTSIDTRDISQGGTYVYGKEFSAFVPPQVRQAEARLVDGMLPLAYVMVGNTGKSVSRSYSRALDCLVPRKATVKTGEQGLRSPGDASYNEAMTYLVTPIPGSGGLTPVDVYIEKQAAWAESQSDWDKAKQRAEAAASTKFPTDIVLQRKSYDDWAQANYRRYKFAVQGRYMDWVANGHKYEVEQNFGIVDVDSIMARIEQSKESLRNSTIVDVDGANEVAGVLLEPKDWATKCQLKAAGWFERNQSYSLAQIEAEINRLERLKISYDCLIKAITDGSYPVDSPQPPPTTLDANTNNLSSKFTALYLAEAKINKQNALVREKSTNADKDAARGSQEYKSAVEAVNTARTELSKAIDNDNNTRADWAKFNNAHMQGAQKDAFLTYLNGQVTIIGGQLDDLRTKATAKKGIPAVDIAVIEGAESDDSNHGTAVAQKNAELANPIFTAPAQGTATTGAGTTPGGTAASNPWTTISASFSAEDQQSTTSTSSWGMSVGGGAGWGLWSVGGSYAHDESKSDSVSDMAKCDVSVTFDALVVNINRPWLYGELFADYELDTAVGVKLSPGAEILQKLMKDQKGSGDASSSNTSVVTELAQYSSFPAYPTSFIIAADTQIEFQGDTQHIESHFSSHSNSGSMSVGWGPFSVSSSFHESSSSQSFQMESTATGCRLSFGAPQIIGWVSEILPALPRNPNYVPMVQNLIS